MTERENKKTYKDNIAKAYDMEITEEAFDTMCQNEDISAAITAMLEKAGKYLEVDQIFVYEFQEKDKRANNTFSWYKTSKKKQNKQLVSDELVMNVLKRHKEELLVDIFRISTPAEEEKLLIEEYRRQGLNYAYIGYIMEDGIISGYISYESNKNEEATTEQKKSMRLTSNVLSMYLMKLRMMKEVKEKLDRIKNYDALTLMPTLYKFKNQVREVLRKNPDKEFAIVYTDFKNFKYINETIGESAADQLLIDYADYLASTHKEYNCFGRVESDKFISLIPYIGEKETIQWVRDFNDAYREELKYESSINNVFLFSGISHVQYGDDVSEAVDNANLARKSLPKNESIYCKFFDQKMKEQLKQEIEITDCMEDALKNNEFTVYLQPKVDLSNNQIIGAEALARWKKKDGTMLPPNVFIPVFEKNGFILQFDFFVYETVCKILVRWREEKRKIVPISVNVSRVHLHDVNFVEKFNALIQKYELPPEWLELELTEGLLLENKDAALKIMQTFREYGYHVSIDDFGSGYSSLNLLKDMATDVLKLDKEFFHSGEIEPDEKIIISSIVSMAKQLDILVVSEGIETDFQSQFLKEIKCDMAQGYYYSRPIPLQDFEKLLTK